MLNEHKAELKALRSDLLELLDQKDDHDTFSDALIGLVEGRISDLESMIAFDKYWEKR